MDQRTALVCSKACHTVQVMSVWGFPSLFGFLAIRELAGENTEAMIDATLTYGSTTSTAFLIALVVLLSLWARWERRHRQNKTAYMANRIQKLEAQIDKNRTSSGLDRNGNTHPRDRL